MTATSPLPGRPHKLTSHMGVEIKDADLRSFTRAGDAQPLIDALTEHSVVVFRDQTLTADDFVAFSRLLGEPEAHVLDQFRMPDRPEIYVLSNIVENGKPIGNPMDGFGWHTDQAYIARPTAYTLLYGIETPAEGADTLFCSTFAALEALSPERQAELTRLRSIQSVAYMHEVKRKELPPLTEEQRRRTPDVIHPMVRRHPFSGRHSLYLGGTALEGIVGIEAGKARAMIQELFAHATKPEFTYAHKWQPRDVVVWDNRSTMHTATDFDRTKYRRLVWRTSLIGEAPIGYNPYPRDPGS